MSTVAIIGLDDASGGRGSTNSPTGSPAVTDLNEKVS
jgi:hypothetical protein